MLSNLMELPGLTPVPGGELDARRARLAAALEAAGLDGVLIATGANLYWLTGLALDGYLHVGADGSAVWMVKRGMARAERESEFSGKRTGVRSLKQVPSLCGTGAGRIGLELDTLPVSVHDRMKEAFGADAEFVDASEVLRETRSTKSAFELDCMRKAAAISATTFEAIPELLAPGRREIEVAADIERGLRARGHPMLFPVHRWGHRFSPLYLCSGPSATLPGTFMGPLGGTGLSGVDPQGCGRRPIERDEPIIIDMCCGERGYLSDQTVTFVIGTLPDDMMQAHALSLAIRDEVAAMLRPGVHRTAPWERAHEMAQAAGLAERFMGLGDDRLSFVGHGLGIEIDEQPVLAPRQRGELAADMVIAVEPKFFFEKRGAVGVEDTFLVTTAGGERLTRGPDQVVAL